MVLSKQRNPACYATPRLSRSPEILTTCRCITRSASKGQRKAEKLLETQSPNIWNKADKFYTQQSNQLHWRWLPHCQNLVRHRLQVSKEHTRSGMSRELDLKRKNSCALEPIMRAELSLRLRSSHWETALLPALHRHFPWIDALLCAGLYSTMARRRSRRQIRRSFRRRFRQAKEIISDW